MKSEADLLVLSRRKSHFKLEPGIILSILIGFLISFELLAQAASPHRKLVVKAGFRLLATHTPERLASDTE